MIVRVSDIHSIFVTMVTNSQWMLKFGVHRFPVYVTKREKILCIYVDKRKQRKIIQKNFEIKRQQLR